VIPFTYNFSVTENASYPLTFTRDDATSATGWAARMEIRAADDPASELYLSIDFTMSYGSGLLTASKVLSEAQIDTLVAALLAAERLQAFYSLKYTHPDTTTDQLYKGTIGYVRTATS
jgi:hypothetical protein